MNSIKRRANTLWYHWRRNNWIIDPRRFVNSYRDTHIDRPIFLVGNQGGGLTLVSRMLRRHQQIVCVSGNSKYWAGADEMQKVMVLRLPEKLQLGDKYWGQDPRHAVYTRPRSWSYGVDELVDWYHSTEDDYTDEAAAQLRFLLRESLYRYGRNIPNARFIDKSQVFTLKIRYINKLLEGCQPHFVLVTRDPYAACYRAALGKAGDMQRYSKSLSLDERVAVCAQHWSNNIQRVMQDKEHVEHFTWVRFEDVLVHTADKVRELCQFLDLPYRDALLPQADDTIPFGSRRLDRWYPLRPNVNDRYLRDIPQKYIDMIAERCEPLAEQFGYERPTATVSS